MDESKGDQKNRIGNDFGRKSRDIRKEENSPHKRTPAHDAYWNYKRVTNFLVLFGALATQA